jgi:hypothetical protein
MVKLQWRLLSPDANIEAGSSSASDDNGAASSATEQVEEQVKESTEENSEETETTEEATTEEQAEVTAEEQTETEVKPVVEKTIDKPEDDKLPFNTHPRFKELVTEKNQFKTELEQSKPLVEQARITNEFLRDNQIQPQEYQSALQYLMLLRKDPTAAYAMLKPTFEQLALLAGERLPSDLQAEVAAGTIAPERATELAKMRAGQNYQQWKNGQQQQTSQMQSSEVVSGTIQSWASTKQSVDPDFKPGTPLWELTDKNIRASAQFRSAQDAQAGSEKAYAEAKAFLQKFQPRAVATVKKPLQSRNVGSNNATVMKTPEDVMRAIQAGVKPSQMKYS